MSPPFKSSHPFKLYSCNFFNIHKNTFIILPQTRKFLQQLTRKVSLMPAAAYVLP